MSTQTKRKKLTWKALVLLTLSTVVLSANAFQVPEDTEIIHLKGEINEESANHVVEKLDSISKDRLVHIYIDSGGGSVRSMYKIMLALDDHQGDITCEVRDRAYSAAAVIFATCDYFKINDEAVIVFHQARQEDEDTGEIRILTPTTTTLTAEEYESFELFTDILGDWAGLRCVLSAEEWDTLQAGEDVVFRGSTYTRKVAQSHILCTGDR